jgi:hypothetical protein
MRAAVSRLANMRLVRQKHAYGCVIASLAMIAGLDYDAVAADYPWIGENDGADLETVGCDFLWRHGFAWQFVYPYRPGPAIRGDAEESRRVRVRHPWPPEPWAEAHLCLVETSMGHCVVMLADGTVLDPLTDRPRRLTDYSRVHNVRGIFDVRP